MDDKSIYRFCSSQPSEDVLAELRAQLLIKHRFDGAAVLGAPPTLWFRVANPADLRTLRNAATSHQLVIIPWGWDLQLGAVLTLTAISPGIDGPPPSVSLFAEDKVFSAIDGGRFNAIFGVGSEVGFCLEVDLAKLTSLPGQPAAHGGHPAIRSSALGLFQTQWDRVRTHVPLFPEPDAAYWDAIERRTFYEEHLSPADRLSIGWASVFHEEAGTVWRLLHDAEAKAAFSTLTLGEEFPPTLRDFVEAVKTYDAKSVVAAVAKSHEAGGGHGLLELLTPSQRFFELSEQLTGHLLASTLRASVDCYLRSSRLTQSGRAMPWLTSNAELRTLELNPRAWNDPTSAATYWHRIPPGPLINLGYLVSGDDVPMDLTAKSPLWDELPKSTDDVEVRASADALLDEALTQKKWTIPPHAVVEMAVGPFTTFELLELGNGDVLVLGRSAEGHFTGLVVEPDKHFFYFPASTIIPEEQAKPIRSALYLLLAAVIRDFWVVETREAVFGVRRSESVAKVRSAAASLSPRIVYLPRVQYTSNADIARCDMELGQKERRAHFVRGHLRKVAQSSDIQRMLAERYGFTVPEGYTFVKPHERGKLKRDTIYRSRSALKSLFKTTETQATSQTVEWFQFERDVYAIMASMGFQVEHTAASRRGDGGVDVYATKGHDLEEVAWVIQCKCYDPKRKVGPSVVRDLIGTLESHSRGTRGMIVTTSSFTANAVTSAQDAGIRLVDGSEFLRMLEDAKRTSS